MFEFHLDRRRYFEMQTSNSRESIIPFVESHLSLPPDARILELGCGEGGVLKGFIEKGYTGTGIEIEKGRIDLGKRWLKNELDTGAMRFIADDLFHIISAQPAEKYHLVVLKDVIEHIADKTIVFERLKQFLHPGGAVFFGFPPWQMPFGGHQQICRNKYLSRFPWLHLAPRKVYKKIMAWYKEPVAELMSIYDARISIEHFEKLARSQHYRILGKKHFLVAPIYQHKFGLREREQLRIIKQLPYLRNLFTTAVYYLVTPSDRSVCPEEKQGES